MPVDLRVERRFFFNRPISTQAASSWVVHVKQLMWGFLFKPSIWENNNTKELQVDLKDINSSRCFSATYRVTCNANTTKKWKWRVVFTLYANDTWIDALEMHLLIMGIRTLNYDLSFATWSPQFALHFACREKVLEIYTYPWVSHEIRQKTFSGFQEYGNAPTS